MTLICREVWWFEPPKPGQTEADLIWGFLEIYSDGEARFIHERPSAREIAERKSCRTFPAAEEDT